MTKVLVVDDSALMRKLLGKVLGEAGFAVEFARNGLEALAQAAAVHPDVITLDIHMPAMDGLEFLDRLMVEAPCPVVMVSSLTAEGADETLAALELGAVDFVAKPAGPISLAIDELASALIEKVAAAAKARLRPTLRLADRVRRSLVREGTATAPRRLTGRLPSVGMVLVGTSTGGPPALETLLHSLPADFPWPILVAQHMPAAFTGPLARRLDKLALIEVVEVSGPVQPQPGTAYIGRGDADLVVSSRGGRLVAMAVPSGDTLWHPSTDRLVRSAMEHLSAAQIVGVLMTGMGTDGAAAMSELRAAGGVTIAEAEETAVVWGMPGELVRCGGADWVLPLPKIADRLRRLAA